jgi:hypothetical protein
VTGDILFPKIRVVLKTSVYRHTMSRSGTARKPQILTPNTDPSWPSNHLLMKIHIIGLTHERKKALRRPVPAPLEKVRG